MTKDNRKAGNKPTKAGAVELSEAELGKAAGGLTVKMEDILVSSYQVSGHGADTQSDDTTLTGAPTKR